MGLMVTNGQEIIGMPRREYPKDAFVAPGALKDAFRYREYPKAPFRFARPWGLRWFR
jgi:hypothetical protein